MDMSGAAAVLQTFAAIAELELPVDLIAVIPSTENMPSGTAIKPGDIITQYNGKTVEVNNTDAEGRLILADALAYAVQLGAERIVDLATLTGAVLIALGSTYAALISNDDDLASEVDGAGGTTGELVWRMPLHPEYKEITTGRVADLPTPRTSARRGRSTPAPSSRSSSTAPPGRTSTSPAPPGTSAAPTRATPPPATASGSWSRSRAGWPADSVVRPFGEPLLLIGDHDVLLEHDSVFRPVRSSLHRDQVVDRGNRTWRPRTSLHRRLGLQSSQPASRRRGRGCRNRREVDEGEVRSRFRSFERRDGTADRAARRAVLHRSRPRRRRGARCCRGHGHSTTSRS